MPNVIVTAFPPIELAYEAVRYATERHIPVLIDVRDLDGERLRESPDMGDNVVALLTRLRDQKDTVDEILGNLSNLDTDAREFYLRALLTVAGLRGLEEIVEEEARKMPLLNDILENRVLGREFKRGELSLLRRQIASTAVFMLS